jgi:hypothetical protein
MDLGYGNTPTEVARYLIQRGIDDLIRDGVIGPLANPPEGKNAPPKARG